MGAIQKKFGGPAVPGVDPLFPILCACLWNYERGSLGRCGRSVPSGSAYLSGSLSNSILQRSEQK